MNEFGPIDPYLFLLGLYTPLIFTIVKLEGKEFDKGYIY